MTIDEIEQLIRRYLSTGVAVVVIAIGPGTEATDLSGLPGGATVVTVEPTPAGGAGAGGSAGAGRYNGPRGTATTSGDAASGRTGFGEGGTGSRTGDRARSSGTTTIDPGGGSGTSDGDDASAMETDPDSVDPGNDDSGNRTRSGAGTGTGATGDTGPTADTGLTDTGPGAGSTTGLGTGSRSDGPPASGSRSSGTASPRTGSSDTGSSDTGSSDTGSSGTASSGTASPHTGSSGTASPHTGSSGTGSSGTDFSGSGSSDAGRTGRGSSGAGTSDTGTSDTGTSGTGTSGTGTSGTGTSGTGTSGTGNTRDRSPADSDTGAAGRDLDDPGNGSRTGDTTVSGNEARTGRSRLNPTGEAATSGTGEGTTAAARFGWGTPNRVDDFDGGTEQWSIYDGPGHAGQGTRSPSAVSVADGILTITGDSSGTTAGMAWNPGQKYGRWEGRVRAPAGDPSYNALLLLWPDAENFPVGGEIDFMEMMDHARQKTDIFIHYGAANSQVHGEVEIDATQWHNWALEWTPEAIAAYVDGEEWYRTTDPSTFPPGPMHLCIQLDWFPKGGTPEQSRMEVQWVRQYSLDGSTGGGGDGQDPLGQVSGTR